MSEPKAIYIVSVFEKCLSTASFVDYPDLGACENVGYFFDFNTADEVVRRNRCDIWEYCFNYAVITKVQPGLYPDAKIIQVYKYDLATLSYKQIQTPDILRRHGLGFNAIGYT